MPPHPETTQSVNKNGSFHQKNTKTIEFWIILFPRHAKRPKKIDLWEETAHDKFNQLKVEASLIPKT